jgi:hypothetical protein
VSKVSLAMRASIFPKSSLVSVTATRDLTLVSPYTGVLEPMPDTAGRSCSNISCSSACRSSS